MNTYKQYIWALAIAGGVIILGVVLFKMDKPGERPGKEIPLQGAEHIQVGATHPTYNSNPPTSGWHYGQSAAWGVYQEALPDEQLIHNLEHGGIWISYKDIAPEIKTKLEALAGQYPGSVVLTPRAQNTTTIALASWGRLQELNEYDEQAIIAFIKANKNKSPEPIAR